MQKLALAAAFFIFFGCSSTPISTSTPTPAPIPTSTPTLITEEELEKERLKWLQWNYERHHCPNGGQELEDAYKQAIQDGNIELTIPPGCPGYDQKC